MNKQDGGQTRITAWHPSQDQGMDEIVKILRSIRSDVPEVAIDRHGYRKIAATDEIVDLIGGMSLMIDLMSPAGRDVTMEHEALERLQRLVHGNLRCIEPELEPYVEDRTEA